MSDVTDYCEKTYRRLVGLKAGLYDVLTKAETVQDSVHSAAKTKLRSLVSSIDAGLEELKTQCPPSWSTQKKELDSNIAELSETLKNMADSIGVAIPDTTAWI